MKNFLFNLFRMKTKFFVFIFMMLVSFLVNTYVHVWWAFIPVIMIFALFLPSKRGHSFLIGFTSIFVLWIVYTLFIDIQNQHILSNRIIQLFHLPNTYILIVITAIFGGLIGGLASITATLIRDIVLNKR